MTDKAVAQRRADEFQAPIAVTPMEILQRAIDKGTDIEQLSKLLDLQQRWEANEARKAFVRALSAFKAEPPQIVKNKHVSFGGRGSGGTAYDHATLDQVSDVIGSALSKHGLSHAWKVQQSDNAMIRVTCVLTHELGHSEETSMQAMPDTSGSKNPIQAVGSTVTYLQRYTLLAATGLAAADQDDDGKRGGDIERINDEQKERIVSRIREAAADTVKFCAYFKIASVDELPADDFDEAMRMLAAKRGQK